jgi:hypothetical protein
MWPIVRFIAKNKHGVARRRNRSRDNRKTQNTSANSRMVGRTSLRVSGPSTITTRWNLGEPTIESWQRNQDCGWSTKIAPDFVATLHRVDEFDHNVVPPRAFAWHYLHRLRMGTSDRGLLPSLC